jgi:hypothetical protein
VLWRAVCAADQLCSDLKPHARQVFAELKLLPLPKTAGESRKPHGSSSIALWQYMASEKGTRLFLILALIALHL